MSSPKVAQKVEAALRGIVEDQVSDGYRNLMEKTAALKVQRDEWREGALREKDTRCTLEDRIGVFNRLTFRGKIKHLIKYKEI